MQDKQKESSDKIGTILENIVAIRSLEESKTASIAAIQAILKRRRGKPAVIVTPVLGAASLIWKENIANSKLVATQL